MRPDNPKVAIVIPIYNVKAYLKECLDSVINQTYQNLQIILVDDASNDGSFEIAKKYFQKDSRIILIQSKQNKGMGASRNTGIYYLSSLASNENGGGAQAFSSIEIHTHPNASKQPPKYLHFLDSDDYLSLDCISECVKLALAFDAEIVWHNHNFYFQENQTMQTASFLKELNLKEEYLYRGLDIFKSLSKPPSFSWVAMGIIDFNFLTKYHLSFQKGIESEDALFGMKLFSLAQKVIISYQESYTYRIRPYSISAHTLTKETKEMRFPESLQDLVEAFKTPYEVRHYSFAYSHCVICLELDAFIQTYPLDEELKEILKEMIAYRAIYAFGALSFKSDPRNCRAMCEKLLPYASQIRFSSKLAYYFPRVFQTLRMIQRKIKGE